ncbi:hypothetical protein HKBW3S03_00970, partial [Candidatus Hakubella thermalkaliphila]
RGKSQTQEGEKTDQAGTGGGVKEESKAEDKARFSGPGMHGSCSGVGNLLPVRTAIMSHRLDELWHRIYNLPPA